VTRSACPLPRRLSGLLAVLAAASFSLLGACGPRQEPAASPGSPAPAVAGQIDACRLFPQSEAAAIAGESVNFRTSVLGEASGRDPALCAYNSGTGEPPKILSLKVTQAASPEAARRLLDTSRSLLRGARPQEVAGVGDGAFWAGSNLQQLHAIAGNLHLVVTIQLQDGGDHREHARGVAQKAVTRLAQTTQAAPVPPA
jgi:hypothetical protein